MDLATPLMPTVHDLIWGGNLLRRAMDKELKAFWQPFDNQSKGAQDRLVQPSSTVSGN